MRTKPSEPAKSISSLKCLAFPTNALFFVIFMWSKMLMLK